GTPMPLLGYPAGSEADEIALQMFRRLLEATPFSLEVASSRLLPSEIVATIQKQGHLAVCVVALPPGGLPHAKYLCKTLRQVLPDGKILVGRWGPLGLGGEGAETLRAAGADAVGATLLETRDQLYQLAPQLSGLESAASSGAATADAHQRAGPV